MVAEDVPVEAVVVPAFEILRIFKIFFEFWNQVCSICIIVDEQPWPIPEIHVGTDKALCTENASMTNRRFNFGIDAHSFCVPSMYAIFELLQDRKHMPSLFPRPDKRGAKLWFIVSHSFINSWFTNTIQYFWIWHLSSRCLEIQFSSLITLFEFAHITKGVLRCRLAYLRILNNFFCWGTLLIGCTHDLLSLILFLISRYSSIEVVFARWCRTQVVTEIAQLLRCQLTSFLSLINYSLDFFFTWSSFLALLYFWIRNALFDIGFQSFEVIRSGNGLKRTQATLCCWEELMRSEDGD